MPGAGIVRATSHAVAPRGTRQNCSDVVPLSGPYQARYAVPAASTATLGLKPAPTVNGAALALLANMRPASTTRTA